MHGYCSCTNYFFILFFLSPLSNYFSPLRLQQPVASPMSTTTQCGRIRRRKKKITTQPPNPAPPPNIATQHIKLTQNQQKINPKSMEKQLENPTQNQDKPTQSNQRTKKNSDEIKAKINQNLDDHHHLTTTTISTQHHPTITNLPPQPISTFDNPNTKSIKSNQK